jgi:hypothetical protein
LLESSIYLFREFYISTQNSEEKKKKKKSEAEEKVVTVFGPKFPQALTLKHENLR